MLRPGIQWKERVGKCRRIEWIARATGYCEGGHEDRVPQGAVEHQNTAAWSRRDVVIDVHTHVCNGRTLTTIARIIPERAIPKAVATERIVEAVDHKAPVELDVPEHVGSGGTAP